MLGDDVFVVESRGRCCGVFNSRLDINSTCPVYAFVFVMSNLFTPLIEQAPILFGTNKPEHGSR